MTHRLKKYQAGDDSFTIQYEIRLTDNQQTENGSRHVASFGVQTGPYIIIVNRHVTVFRDGSEKVALNCSAELFGASSSVLFNSSDPVTIRTQCRLADNSTAEPQQVFFRFYPPPYMAYVANSLTPQTYHVGSLSASLMGSSVQIQVCRYCPALNSAVRGD